MGWIRFVGALGVALLALASAAGAEDQAAPSAQPTSSQPAVALDQLLTLPTDRTYAVEKKGGLTRGEWRKRYLDVRTDLVKEREALALTEEKLSDAAGAGWAVNPIPGTETDTSRSPVDFQLRTELRRHRDEIERLERKIRQLDIEANLAGVPEDWRR
jgi:hypothetical protein